MNRRPSFSEQGLELTMALVAGTRLGAYEITGSLGAGGMGEVYRATDATLGRDVAIKVLPDSFASDPQRIARFEQEAKTLATLNHVHIAQVYGLEKTGESTALVMELVEGPTLEDRIAQGPIPVDEALQIAMQIADALEAAHGKQIIHRDLKPANVKLAPDSVVKLLDFGIAKNVEPTSATSRGRTPTLMTPALTEAGVLLGTAAYMSPEQARGKATDQRTDIWAFGCVLYEMLAAQPAFGGEDVTSTLARILEREAEMDALPATIPPAVLHTISQCLQKEPRDRVADIRDVKLALAGRFIPEVAGARSEHTGAATVPRSQAIRYAAAAFAIGVAASTIAIFASRAPEPQASRVVQFSLSIPTGEVLGLDNQSQSLAITRDGTTIAFATTVEANQYDWYLRSIDSVEPRPLRGARSTFETPFFSPDGSWIGFDGGDGVMWRLSVLGGTPIRIVPLESRLRGASWGEDGDILYAVQGNGLWRIGVDGGEPEQLTVPEIGAEHRWPQWLPGQQAALFALSNGQIDQIAMLDVVSREIRILIPEGSTPAYTSNGYIVYGVADGSLREVPFDLDKRVVTGESEPLIEGVAYASATRGMHYALSDEGTLVYGSGDSGVLSGLVPYQPVWLSETGNDVELGIEPCACVQPSLSPDGSRLALVINPTMADMGIESDIWIWSFAPKTLTRLTFERGPKSAPVWSPDSRRIAYLDLSRGIVIRNADGTGAVQTIVPNTQAMPSDWTSDDRLIFSHRGASGVDVSIVALTPGAKPAELLGDELNESEAALSPDGRWLAYVSRDASGRPSLFVRPFPDVDSGRWQIGEPARTPKWSSDGSKLFFESLVASQPVLMQAPIATGSAFAFGTPSAVVSRYPRSQTSFAFGYAVAPGTDRILAGRPVNESETEFAEARQSARAVVVEHFSEMLKPLASGSR